MSDENWNDMTDDEVREWFAETEDLRVEIERLRAERKAAVAKAYEAGYYAGRESHLPHTEIGYFVEDTEHLR